MGKKYTNHYTGTEETYTRRKEKMAQKNQHAKKNGSNYHPGAELAKAAAEKINKQERVQLPFWLKTILIILFTALLVTLVLRLTSFKDSMTMSYISSLMLGVACGALFYIRKYYHKEKKGASYGIITLILAVVCVVYTAMGLLGLFGILG
ncbi:MAG: hypothetical protein GXW99_04230 [Clostridiales bacterium]|nr:hypothetical protein [Clostridiales bacterium]